MPARTTSAMEARRAELINGLTVATSNAMAAAGLEPLQAMASAVAILDAVTDAWSGNNLMFPSERRRQDLARNSEIRAAFTGFNTLELSRRFGLSERHIRAILVAAPPSEESGTHMELIQHAIDIARSVLARRGVAQSPTDAAAREVVNYLGSKWGGAQVSFPIRYRTWIVERDARALAMFDGTNLHAVAQALDVQEDDAQHMVDRARARSVKPAQQRA
ncbi:Mor transcription activator family protein [Variovorax sp.]|uniref:Mor transcription activator family protein n=1 Tax=Variovorax sp. TaxID=1871043 RepID=UPI003BA93B41